MPVSRLVAIALGAIFALCLAAGLSAHSGGSGVGRHLLQTRGIWTEFDDPYSRDGWYSGELLHNGNFDPARSQILAQLNAMRAMGVNEITYELRSADAVWIPGRTPPECNVSPDTGLQWPQPTEEELTNLGRLFDLAGAKGMRVALILDTSHMEDRVNSERWLGAILEVVKGKAALDYVSFGGDNHLIDLNGNGVPESCGGIYEAPLWLGPSSPQGLYVEWAIGLGMSRGLPARQLTAESIVGFYPAEVQAPGGGQDHHLWSPIASMRTIFDRLDVPEAERTYAISYYAHRKCSGFNLPNLPCADEDPQSWAEETADHVRRVAGPAARVTASEFGETPVEPSWTTERAVEGIGVLMQRYGIDGGVFWRWQDVTGEAPASIGDPVKKRGSFNYYPVQRELADLYGFHLTAIPNGSFESGTSGWTITGRGGARLLRLDENAPWRGARFLRLTTTRSVTATSTPIQVSPSVVYTTTANLRFTWKARSKPTRKPMHRAQVDIRFRYLTCRHRISRVRRENVFRYFHKNSTRSFRTFPLKYRTPKDACYVQIQLIAAANRRALGMTVDVDNLR